jgi:hypothetical protein
VIVKLRRKIHLAGVHTEGRIGSPVIDLSIRKRPFALTADRPLDSRIGSVRSDANETRRFFRAKIR